MNENTDATGKISGKRKYGIILIKLAIGIASIYFVVGIVMAVLKKDFTYIFPFDLWVSILGIGGSMLGITIFENKNKT